MGRDESRRALRRQPLPGREQARRPALAGGRVGRPEPGRPGHALPQDPVQEAGKRLSWAWCTGSTVRRRASFLLAKTSKAAGRLSEQFREGTISKVYWAIVEGNAREQEGEWVDLLEKDAGRTGPEVVDARVPSSKEARVAFRVLDAIGAFHQARAAASDRPKPSASRSARQAGTADRRRSEIWGDDAIEGPGRPFRIALHARQLTFTHPTRREAISVDAPIPADWPELSTGGRE